MNVKIGNSYVSAEAASFAKNSADDDKKTSPLNKKNKKSWLESLLPEKKSKAAVYEKSKKFANANELTKHLQKNYSIVKNGAANISKKYLQKCLEDEGERQKLFENLEVAGKNFDNPEKGKTLRIKIDDEGNMTMESSSGKVAFNEAQRSAQLSAAKTSGEVEKILKLLEKDLEECKAGLEKNWCEESEVKKVEKMIERAEKYKHEVEKNPAEIFLSVDILV